MATTEEDLKLAIEAALAKSATDNKKAFEDETKKLYGITPDYTYDNTTGIFDTGRVLWHMEGVRLEWQVPGDAAWLPAESSKRELVNYLESTEPEPGGK